MINPLLELIGQTLTAQVAPLFAPDGERLVVWFDPCHAKDSELQLKRWEVALRVGAVTSNEYRTNVLNLPAEPRFDDRAVDMLPEVVRLATDWREQADLIQDIAESADRAAADLCCNHNGRL